MKRVTCRNCGVARKSNDAFKRCICGMEDITIKMDVVSDLINSRSDAEVRCASCNHEIFGNDVDAYPHDGGWSVPGLGGKWWLSIQCDKCDYETSFNKLGINK